MVKNLDAVSKNSCDGRKNSRVGQKIRGVVNKLVALVTNLNAARSKTCRGGQKISCDD